MSAKKCLLLLIIVFFNVVSNRLYAQLTGTKNIPGDYSTVAAAVAALNSSGVGSGGVIFNVAAGYTETISATISITASGTSSNPILFRKNGAGANPRLTAYTGGTATPASATQDGIIRLQGSDYITFDGIDVRDNPSNTTNPATMEYGYALYKASATNGCNHVTIKNCTITLNRVNNATGTSPMVDGSAGIIVMNATATAATTILTLTSSNGTNSDNSFYSNTIQNCNTGIALIGYAAASPFTLADANNDIGGSGSATGNTIINFGGASSAANAAVGVRTLAQYNLNISYNTINNNSGSGVNHPNILRGIYTNSAVSASATISNNIVTVKGAGTTQHIYGIDNLAGGSGGSNTIDITNNLIQSCTYTTASTGGFHGINNAANPTTLNITGNTITNNSSAATTTGFFYCIRNSGAAATTNINNNIISGNTTANIAGAFIGISNTAACPNLSISSNSISNSITTSTAGLYYAILNSGVVTGAITINNNNIGTAAQSAVTFNAANNGAQLLIANTKGANTSALSISGNNFRNINYATAGTGACTFISNTATTRSQDINNNVFANLNVNTSGSVVFMTNSVVVPATGNQNVNGNSISGTFTKAAGGGVTVFSSSASSTSGSVINNNNNNFSNITVSGATALTGWVNTDAGSSTKNIQGNTFSNWSGGTGNITGMSISINGTNNSTSGNAINNISCACTLIGIATAGSGNDKISANTINSLQTTATSAIGISITAGTQKNIFGNKIYDLQATNAGGVVTGIVTTGTSSSVIAANIYNNFIGDLRAPSTSATDAVRGIAITSSRANSSINVYYNTIYLNATSTGTNFGTSGITHTASATATTASLTLRNNIVINVSTPNGTGRVTAYRRSSTNQGNFGTSSNNNLYFAGSPSSNRLIFYDGTNSDQTIVTYKARVGSRETQSVTEDLTTKFLSTSGASSDFLRLDPFIETQAESGGVNISGYSRDYDNTIRQGNVGYTGTGTSPDMGADEFEGIEALPLSGVYTLGTGGDFTSLTTTSGLFAAINSLGLAGDVEVNVISDLTEDGSNILNEWIEQGVGNYTLTIQAGSANVRTISGNVATPLIRLNGAKRVTIDGNYNGNGKYLSFKNLNTAGTGTAFTFINGASNNTIQNCLIEAYGNATNGVVLFSTSTVSGGNSNNTLQGNDINGTVSGNNSNVIIYSGGTTTAGFGNSTNTISYNNISNYRDRGIDIPATGSTGFTITGNHIYNGAVSGSISYAGGSLLHGVRVLGGSGYTIMNNIIGGSATNAGGAQASYSSTGLVTYYGIQITTSAATPATSLKGNRVSNISISAVPTVVSSSGANIFMGIETNGSGISVGGNLAGEGNIIGSNTVNGSISLNTTTTLATHRSNARGFNINSTGGVVNGNQVGGIDINNQGSAAGPTRLYGIAINAASAPSQVNDNIIGSTGTGAATHSIRVLSSSLGNIAVVTGIIVASTVTSSVQLDGNIVSNLSNLTTITNTNGTIVAGLVSSAAGTATITFSNNTVTRLTFVNVPSTTGISFIGIQNTGAVNTLNITGNTINGFLMSSTVGLYNAILNSGAVTTAININNNNIGDASEDALTLTAAHGSGLIWINNTGGANTCALSISNNNIQGINYNTASTGSNVYILNSAATLSQTINGNTFTGLNVNTTGNITFISNNVAVGATGVQNINNNSISGGYTRSGTAGALTFYNSTATSASGAVINNTGNDFSNITIGGTATIAGWLNTDAGAGTKTISNNTFSNITSNTGTIVAMNINLTNANNSITGNTISGLTSAGAITGILTAAGNDNIFNNTINTFNSSGNAAVMGISVTAGTSKRIYRNKIYDLQTTNATGTVQGISVSGSTLGSANIYNNLIGDLRSTMGNSTSVDLVRGISITATAANSAINVYFNTIYLNATSSGANFSTSGIYHTTSGTTTTAALTLRNNSITNTSTPNGSGLTVAYRRSSTTLGNYHTTSNNNLFYGGTPGTNRLIFYDGSNADQTLAAFKTTVSAREAQSVTEDLTSKFLSTAGASSVFLHMSTSTPSLVESGAVNISGITEDYDGQVRQGNPGYSGSGTAPDIGADEVFGIEAVPPVISYTLLSNTTVITNRNVTGVTITDASGVNINSGTKPRIYYKRMSDANTYVDNTSNTNGWKFAEATNAVSPFAFTIDYSILYCGSAVTAGAFQYFIVAQDLATIPNIGVNSGTFNAMPSSVALTAAAFPISGVINNYQIPFSGTYNVGTGEVYTSLTRSSGIFSAINTVGLMGNVVINVTSNLSEDGTNSLAQWTESGVGNYKLKIQPDATTSRLISGNATTALIKLDGADRVKIDGSDNTGSGEYITIRNTNTLGSAAGAISFLNGATSDSVLHCVLESFTNAASGVVSFGTSSVLGGNSNNSVAYNNINATVSGNTSSTAIYVTGSASAGYENINNEIGYNNIFAFREKGISVNPTGANSFNIHHNSIYNGVISSTINYASGSSIYGVNIEGGTGHNVSNNYIGSDAPLATGANSVYNSTSGNVTYNGIAVNGSGNPHCTIKGNLIAKITVTPATNSANAVAFRGIYTSGSGVDIGGATTGEGNIIGSNTNNGSITVTTSATSLANTSLIYGIKADADNSFVTGNQVTGVDISDIGATPASSSFYGLHVDNATAATPVNLNIIGSIGTGAINNSIRIRAASLSQAPYINGITIGNAVNNTITMSDNTVQNFSINSTTSSGSFIGIRNNAASGSHVTLANNFIKNITSNTNNNINSTSYKGIYCTASTTLTGNEISNINYISTGNATSLFGIQVAGSFVYDISANTVQNLTSAGTKNANIESGAATGYNVVGILNESNVPGQVVANNNLHNFSVTTISAIATAISGIAFTGSASGSVYNNRVSGYINTATGSVTTPGINGITIADGSYNVYNNVVKLDNSFNINGIRIYGIHHAASTASNYYYNSVAVSGNVSGTATRTAAFIRNADGAVAAINNLFLNTRLGTGIHYGVSNIASSPSTNWSGVNVNHNNIYSSTQATTAEWGNGTDQTFVQWQTSSSGDAQSVNRSVTFVTSLYDLEPSDITNCAMDNTATPVTSPINIATDINNVSRNATTPAIGAYEFNYIPFVILLTNTSPVCDGTEVDFTADPGDAYNPSYLWKDPTGVNVSTSQNPNLVAIAGYYKLIVTDENGCEVMDSTFITLFPRPTATMSGSTTICENASTNITLHVTGTGTISGTLNTGLTFSGTAPTIVISVSPNEQTVYTIVDMQDANCTSLPQDIPDTVTVNVILGGLWTGLVNSNWNNAGNWLCNVIPYATTDVIIPGSPPFNPTITSGTVTINKLTMQSGSNLTLNGATLQIANAITNSGGTIHAGSGTIELNGGDGQNIPPNLFSGNILHNLIINDSSDVTLQGALNITGYVKATQGDLITNNFLTLQSTTTGTALIDATGTGAILGNVTMQRYLPSGYGYRYISSPFQSAPVSELADDLNLAASFPPLYEYDESKVSTGWESYINPTDILTPLKGYAAHFGAVNSPKTIDIQGVVNNGVISSLNLYNNNRTYTQGFNLVGNPYPSPINWDAATGWTKTNIDNAVYYFNAGTTDPYVGTYSSYINGVSSDGIANNIIPSMQGFFVHVSNGTYPVNGVLGVNNDVRVNTANPAYHKTTTDNDAAVRITLQSATDSFADALLVYFNQEASNAFERDKDALKLMNTDPKVPNLYGYSSEKEKLSITAIKTSSDTDRYVPLGVRMQEGGNVTFTAKLVEELPMGMHVYLLDKEAKLYTDLQKQSYNVSLNDGSYDKRFYLHFTRKNQVDLNLGGDFNIVTDGSKLIVTLDAFTGESGTLYIRNIAGQTILSQTLTGFGSHEIGTSVATGIYIVSFAGDSGVQSKKVILR